MPPATNWERFFDPVAALARLACINPHADVVDLACGYGTFTAAAAALTTGTVHALDIDPAMAEATRKHAQASGCRNIEVAVRDCLADGTGLPPASVACVLLFNILHGREPQRLLREAQRILRPGGKIATTHWVHDAATPRGPALAIRPRPEDITLWLQAVGFDTITPVIPLPPWHFGLTAIKPTL